MTLAKQETPKLLPVEVARRLLAECRTVDEAKQIRDQAQAVAIYLRSQKASAGAQADAGEVKLRAERRLGQLLEEQKAAGLRADQGTHRKKSHDVISSPPTLKDMGISGMQSARWQDVARVPEKKFEEHVATLRSQSERITTARVTAPLKRERRQKKLAAIAKGSGPTLEGRTSERYAVIYADPPWQYEHVPMTDSRSLDNQYPQMPIEAICSIRPWDKGLEALATEDAVLFLWVTPPLIPYGLQVVKAWDFTYRTCAVWVKDKIGMGYYFRQQHELLFVATRGRPPTPEPSARISSVFQAARTRHSEKPEIVAEAIEKMYPNLPKLELFARSSRPNWDRWGNEA